LEPRLQSRIDKSQALQQIREQWLSRALHDLRGPLFAARGYARLVLNDTVTVTQRRYIDILLDNLERLSGLVNTLNEFPSDAALDLEPVELRDLLTNALANFNDAVTLHSEIVLGDALWTVADGAKVSTAVHKLLTFLVDFSHPSARLSLNAAQEGDEVAVRCQGSAARDGASAQSRAEAGIAAARRIIQLHGGSASAGVASSGEVHVTFRLPLIPPVR